LEWKVLSGVVFVRSPSVRNICYNRKLNITLNFMFHMYDKKIYKYDATCSLPPPPCHKLSHLFGSPTPSSETYFMDGPITLFFPNMVIQVVRLLGRPRMSNFDAITAEVTISGHKAV